MDFIFLSYTNRRKISYKFVADFEYFLRKRNPTDHQKPMQNNSNLCQNCRCQNIGRYDGIEIKIRRKFKIWSIGHRIMKMNYRVYTFKSCNYGYENSYFGDRLFGHLKINI